jgi:hypothetical protein
MQLQLRQPIDSHTTTATCPSFKRLPRASSNAIKMLSKQCIKTLGLPPKKFSGMLRPSKDALGLNLQTYSKSLTSAAEITCSAWAAAPTTNCKPTEVSDHMVEPPEPNQSSANAVENVTICTVQNVAAELKTEAEWLQN